MIRIPFSADAGEPTPPLQPVDDKPYRRKRDTSDELESRLHLLESTLSAHAEELKRGVTERVERIESRFHRAMISLTLDDEGNEAANVVEFEGDDSVLHHLPTTAAIDAINELNDTLQLTREHLDALGSSVARMRRSFAC